MNSPHLTLIYTFKTARNTIVFIEGNYIINKPNHWNKHKDQIAGLNHDTIS